MAAEEGEAEHKQPRTPTVSQMWGHDDDGMNISPIAFDSSNLHNDPALVDAQMQIEEKKLEKQLEQVLDEALHDVQNGCGMIPRDID